MRNKRGQVTIFIIIAVIIVAIVVGYLLLKGSLTSKAIPASIEPAYTSFLTCLQEDTQTGINVLESQGGYIELPDFEPGSAYMPFSSQLDFAGNPIPYWYYVSGNNIPKEQVPTTQDMEVQLANFIQDEVRNCDLRAYYDEGFVINMGEPQVTVAIDSNKVTVDMDMALSFAKENDTALVKTHEITVNSELGQLYDEAKTVYQDEQDNLFLENYGRHCD